MPSGLGFPWGFLLIMAATEPTTVHMSLEEYLELCEEWVICPEKTAALLSRSRLIGAGTRVDA